MEEALKIVLDEKWAKVETYENKLKELRRSL